MHFHRLVIQADHRHWKHTLARTLAAGHTHIAAWLLGRSMKTSGSKMSLKKNHSLSCTSGREFRGAVHDASGMHVISHTPNVRFSPDDVINVTVSCPCVTLTDRSPCFSPRHPCVVCFLSFCACAADPNRSRVGSVQRDSIDSKRCHARVVCIANKFALRQACACGVQWQSTPRDPT
jgi:hypothetical protein